MTTGGFPREFLEGQPGVTLIPIRNYDDGLIEYYAAVGDAVFRFEGTLERFTGDGVMVVFNDPMPCDDAGPG